MGKFKSALAAASLEGIEGLIMLVPDPALRMQLMTMTYAVKVPYAFLKELLPNETDKYLSEILTSGKIAKRVIESPEFQQALGETLQNMVYVKEKEKRDIIKAVFADGYISADIYAKNNQERLQEVAQRISIPALQHLKFLCETIVPRRDQDIKKRVKEGENSDMLYRGEKGINPLSKYVMDWVYEEYNVNSKKFDSLLPKAKSNHDLINKYGRIENKVADQFAEYDSELISLGILRTVPTFDSQGYELTEFGKSFCEYIKGISLESNPEVISQDKLPQTITG